MGRFPSEIETAGITTSEFYDMAALHLVEADERQKERERTEEQMRQISRGGR